MTHTRAAQIRQAFLEFFARHGHTVVKSSSLIPANDPTLMFTNAGMVQFKDVFVGAETRPYSRATSAQKCMRVSGKHNDLGEVGRTARHHTLFEMLGNFSFGDYFKEEAIRLAWDFITREVGLDASRLWVTVFSGEEQFPADEEARQLWLNISGLPEERILSFGMKENFWAMGETGPCGPCTEIHYDLGGDTTPTLDDFENGRIVEIWNNVFMQYERKTDGTIVSLPRPSVDTGMGLERLAAVLQGERSNYHTDLFLPILQKIAGAAGKTYGKSDSEDDVSMRVIADHARATAFLVADGLQPSNEGRGYVMRRIMRRAIRHGRRLGFEELFFDRACQKVVDTMKDAYPELAEAESLINKVAQTEELSFRRTLDTGLRILGAQIDEARREGREQLPGEAVFRLYDTYGFPRDLTEVIAAEHGLGVDEEGFAQQMQAQKERSRGSDLGGEAVADVYKQLKARLPAVTFVGYTHEDAPLESRDGNWRIYEHEGRTYLQTRANICALIKGGVEVDEANEGQIDLVLDPTPFYGEAGGQVGDQGLIITEDASVIAVDDNQKPLEGLTVTKGRLLHGTVRKGQTVWAGYEPQLRKRTRAHHSATHILHHALRDVLGDHVKQAGSLVDPERLRFDYSHFEAPTWEQLRSIEDAANTRIQENLEVCTEELPFDEAKQRGAVALFGEKYGDVVRVVAMGPSMELCGGTHARNTADIDMLLITREEAVASGVRRVEARVNGAAREEVRETVGLLEEAEKLLSGEISGETHSGHPALAALAKLIRSHEALAQQVSELGEEPARVDVTGVSAPELSADFDAGQARTVRDLWQGIVQMTSARANEAEMMAKKLADAGSGELPKTIAALMRANRDNERLIDQLRRKHLSSAASDLLDGVREVAGVRLLTTRVDDVDGKALRELADDLRSRLGTGVLCIGGRSNGKATLLVAVTKDLTGRFQAGKLIKELAPLVGGRGGGKPELAQAGGSDPAALESAFEKLDELVQQAKT